MNEEDPILSNLLIYSMISNILFFHKSSRARVRGPSQEQEEVPIPKINTNITPQICKFTQQKTKK